MTYILIFISAVFVNNIVLAQFLGVCPFLGVSKKTSTAVGMSSAVAFVLIVATIFIYAVQRFVLEPFQIEFLRTIVFILIIAALVQSIEIILKKVSPPLYRALGIFLPLMTTNCAILGVAILVVQRELSLLESTVFAVSTAVGFGLALIVFTKIREQLSLVKVPKALEGTPISLITVGLLAMAFMGFAGIVSLN